MKPSESDSQTIVFEAFLAVEADIAQIRTCRVSITQKEFSSTSVALAHAMEMACVAACTVSLGDPSTASRRMEEGIRNVWESRASLKWVFRDQRERENACLRYEWATLQWKAERAYESEVERAKLEFDRFAEHRWVAFRTLESKWKSAEQQFRKPVLGIYKQLLELFEMPAPEAVLDVGAQLNARLGTHVVDALTHRKTVFLEQQGVSALITDITFGMQQLPEQIGRIVNWRCPFRQWLLPLCVSLSFFTPSRCHVHVSAVCDIALVV